MPLTKLGALKGHSGLLSGSRRGKSECTLKDGQDWGRGWGRDGPVCGGRVEGAKGIQVGEAVAKSLAQGTVFPEAPGR